MLILAIETSCDETSAAIIKKEPQKQPQIISLVISSQIKLHSKWGGVVPNLAAREHLKNILPVIRKTFQKTTSIKLNDIDILAVTQGPGLIPALLVGVNAAKTISYFFKKPLLGIHHLEGHIYANFVDFQNQNNLNPFDLEIFPLLVLLVSGGHTQLILMKKHFHYQIIGQTRDDAVGEAFDKVAKILKLPYPGGPHISNLAQKVLPQDFKITEKIAQRKIKFPLPMVNSGNLDFSFSGIKTAVLYTINQLQKNYFQEKQKNDALWNSIKKVISFEFEEAATEILAQKTFIAIRKYHPKTLILAGGVAANQILRKKLQIISDQENLLFSVPPFELCQDNAAMIGIAAALKYEKIKKNKIKILKRNWQTLQADPNLKLF